MKVFSKKAFTAFYEEVKNKFPYKDVRITRQSFNTKWLLMNTNIDHGIPFHDSRVVLLQASALSQDIIQHIIMRGQGVPLPQDFTVVVDSMVGWGRSINAEWYYRFLDYLDYIVCMEDLDRRNYSSRQFCYDVIHMRVHQMLNDSFEGDHEAVARTRQQWVNYFWESVVPQIATNDFYSMAQNSFDFTLGMIDDEREATQEYIARTMEVEPVVSSP